MSTFLLSLLLTVPNPAVPYSFCNELDSVLSGAVEDRLIEEKQALEILRRLLELPTNSRRLTAQFNGWCS